MEMVKLLLRKSPAQRSLAPPDRPELPTVRGAEPALCGLLRKSPAQRSLARRNIREFLTVWRAEPALCGLLWKSRKTECGAKRSLIPPVVRAAPFALLVCALLPAVASAAGFTLTIGPPVAAGTGSKVVKTKSATFAVRLEECEDLATAWISGTAEGLVNGARTSAPVTLNAAAPAGVYLVSQDWSSEGVWVVSLSATCGSAKAGAIVPMGPQGFLRDGTKILPRAATKAEIDAALKALEKPVK
jgi:hypothetical protein